jgi:hypothetical protein
MQKCTDPTLGGRYKLAFGLWRTTYYLVLLAQSVHVLCKASFMLFVSQHAMQSASPGWKEFNASGQQRLGAATVMSIGKRVRLLAKYAPYAAAHFTLASVDAFVGIKPLLLTQA